MICGCVLLAALGSGQAPAAEAEKWIPLFDGKSLKGWHPLGEGKWTVEDGAIVGRADKTKLYGLLFSDDQYDDFTVRFQFKCLAGDSGFYIRTIFKAPDEAHGNQVQVGLAGSGTGGIYESYGRGWVDKPTDEQQKKILKDGDWNDMVITAQGRHRVHVNGVKTADEERSRAAQRHFALQMHLGQPDARDVQGIEMKPSSWWAGQ
jgi:hypothetical protein